MGLIIAGFRQKRSHAHTRDQDKAERSEAARNPVSTDRAYRIPGSPHAAKFTQPA
jgi:hypothetical protein